MTDTYRNYAELAAHEVEGRDFRIVVKEGRSGIVIVAPHGGKIEAYTSDIATGIALEEHALYLFEGCSARGNGRLHVTSEHFDELRGRDIVARSSLAIGVHGASGDEEFVIVGGRNTQAKALMLAALAKFGATDVGPAHLQGSSHGNICNRARDAGVQLEISLGLRNKLSGADRRLMPDHATAHMREFTDRARQALTEYQRLAFKDTP
ncbi:poly-gamma-glutamate hydrolase family protein [Massilia sp. erpn]|uniref:poly-gamma-glutamate hydrolase family protein n=1 Tax=Massilia sp. erpn TaxID=2738142 RepID=UPI0021084D7D|nr:poly-gamma-glutamate hydrolase family protein [Massilia sp. erpn]UTY59487.1 replication protein [Massilia sp. erpn]